MGKAVQHPCIPAKLLYGQAVIFLVKEITCLLPLLHIHKIFHTIFFYHNIGVKFFPYKPLGSLHPLIQPYLGVASFINAPYADAILGQKPDQNIQDLLFHPVDPQCQGFHYKDIRKLINNKPGKEIRLPENNTAASCIHHFFTVLPGVFYSLP